MTTQRAPNSYSQEWFNSFHLPITVARTRAEVDFVCSFAPLPDFSRIADVCCGMGRHARLLAAAGYSVTGVDRDAIILAQARKLGGGVRYLRADLRDYRPEPGEFDAVIIMGQSFGHFDAASNQAILERLTAGLRAHGRLILDLWEPQFFEAHQGKHDFELTAGVVRETKRVEHGRLFVHLAYPSGEEEDFEWQLFTRTEMDALAESVGLKVVACCSDYHHDQSQQPYDSKPRVQYVLERESTPAPILN